MTIEEAIERLKDLISKSKVIGDIEINKQVAFKDIETILNLIEKQSKEIEELKNEVMEKELIIDGMKEDRRIAVEEIQEEYFISKDKIKAKIEEYEQDVKDFEEYWSKDPRKFKKEKSVDYYKLEALKELLEKE